ncbi:hypothetical protein HK100_005444 [Physocladia obscura]|uniref:Uncharacterized protein n=1 Tax=Physocladia obscura TaxID=109957 RepID=A0AAD5X837_9FUNG|nr:hypothetical protein HK100_005444 [Physocladia obscura]
MDAASRTVIIAVFAAILALAMGVAITLLIRRRNSRRQMYEIASHNESRIAAMERTGVHSTFTITGARSGDNAGRMCRYVRSDQLISTNPNAIVKNNNPTHIAIDKPAAAHSSAASGGTNAHNVVWPFLQHNVSESAMSDYSESGRSTATSTYVEPFEFVAEQRDPSARSLATFTPRKAVIDVD